VPRALVWTKTSWVRGGRAWAWLGPESGAWWAKYLGRVAVDGQQHEPILRRAAVHGNLLQRGGGGERGGGGGGGGSRAAGGVARLGVSLIGLCGVAASGDGRGLVGTHVAHHVLWGKKAGERGFGGGGRLNEGLIRGRASPGRRPRGGAAVLDCSRAGWRRPRRLLHGHSARRKSPRDRLWRPHDARKDPGRGPWARCEGMGLQHAFTAPQPTRLGRFGGLITWIDEAQVAGCHFSRGWA
jgi:hypothetical protein